MRGILKKVSFNRSIKPTREGLGFILLTLATGTAAINTGNNLLYLILAAMLSMIIVSGILSEWSLRGIDAARRLPQHIFASKSFPLRIAVTNSKRFLSSFSLVLKEKTKISGQGEVRLFRIPPHYTSYASYDASFERRGRHILEGFIISTLFPFGFFIKSLKRSSSSYVIVYPRIDRLPESIKEELSTTGNISEEKHKGRGSTLYNIRDYRAGEDTRSIHWKSSARQSRLMLKEFEKEEERTINLFLFNSLSGEGPIRNEDMDIFEKGVEITASLASYLLNKHFSIGLFTLDRFTPPSSGTKHLYRILEELALLDIKEAKGRNLKQESIGLIFKRLAQYNGTNILILPWDSGEIAKIETLFHKILRIGGHA